MFFVNRLNLTVQRKGNYSKEKNYGCVPHDGTKQVLMLFILFSESKQVEFYQLTMHDYNLDHFSLFVSNLEAKDFIFKIFFVLPTKSANFRPKRKGTSSKIHFKGGSRTPEVAVLKMNGL